MTDEPWNSLQYRRIDRAVHQRGILHVRFSNGDEVEIETSRLLPVSVRESDWDHVRCDGIELEVRTQTGPCYVFWETIRELTDPAYATRLDDADATYRLQTGQQIRKLRQRRGMTGRYVAARAGINNQSLSRIEHGTRGVTLTTLRRILNAMGYSLKDMVLDPVETVEPSNVVAHT